MGPLFSKTRFEREQKYHFLDVIRRFEKIATSAPFLWPDDLIGPQKWEFDGYEADECTFDNTL